MSEAPPSTTYSMDPTLYIYTSLTAGSSHIVTATSRLETILRANRIPFRGVDLATDDKARMLWGRRAGKDHTGRQRKMPALVQEGLVIGDLVEIEDWNEYGELKQHVKIVGVSTTPARPVALGKAAAKPAAAAPAAPKQALLQPIEPPKAPAAPPVALAMRDMGAEAAQKAKDMQKKAVQVGAGTGGKGVAKAAAAAAAPAPEKAEEARGGVPHAVAAVAILQDPLTSAWSLAPGWGVALGQREEADGEGETSSEEESEEEEDEDEEDVKDAKKESKTA